MNDKIKEEDSYSLYELLSFGVICFAIGAVFIAISYHLY